MTEDLKPKRKWQNLFYKKCPNCDAKFDDKGKFLICPTSDREDPKRSCFFIRKDAVIEMLQNPEHPAHYCLQQSQRDSIPEVIAEF